MVIFTIFLIGFIVRAVKLDSPCTGLLHLWRALRTLILILNSLWPNVRLFVRSN
jgi:hypothetical protein